MRHPTAEWVLQMSRNATDKESGHPDGQRYSLHDRDTKFCPAFGMYYDARECGRLCYAAAAEPQLECVCRAVGPLVKRERLSKLSLFGETALRQALTEYAEHYHSERNHEGKENQLLFPGQVAARSDGQRRVL